MTPTRETGKNDAHARPAPSIPTEPAARRELLKSIVRELHLGGDVVALERRFDGLLAHIGAVEIGRIENELIAEGLPVEEVQRLCDLHARLFRPGEAHRSAPDLPPGHPVRTFLLENRVFERAVWGLQSELDALGEHPSPATVNARLPRIARLLGVLAGIGLHYTRKEQLLFPLLEAKGVSGPTQVMWGVQDDLRALLGTVRDAALDGDGAELVHGGTTLARGVTEMILKEEAIMFPMALELLDAADWNGIAAIERDIGVAAELPAAEISRRLPLPSIARDGIGALWK